MKKIISTFILVLLIAACKKTPPPKPLEVVPSERHLAWHDLEYYGFLHFNINTFTDIEWGSGAESPKIFNPTQLDCMQWARIAKEAGMKGLIITAKHHDGFCIWPSKYTEHSVKNSPWKNGQGDVLKELAEACKKYGLKFGVYLSPWDRNHADYAKPSYVDYFHKQLRELLTSYGDIFEVWFDGANGGSGYYGGANETRKITEEYYRWEETIAIVRELQPNAVIFGSPNRDIRWVGNEEGYGHPTNWATFSPSKNGWTKESAESGVEDGIKWNPAECDVSVRPGWYYHKYEDTRVKSLAKLMDIYYNSVGNNASLLLNIPIDKRGLVHEKDEEQLLKFATQIKKDFTNNLLKHVTINASNTRGNDSDFAPENCINESQNKYWATDDGVNKATININFPKPTALNRLVLQEYIKLGQRVQSFKVEAEIDGQLKEITKQTTIGYKRILKFDRLTASKIIITILSAKGPITLKNIEAYNAPNLLIEPNILRNAKGEVTLKHLEKTIDVYYTLDGKTPNKESKKYTSTLLLPEPVTIKAIAYDATTNNYSEIASKDFDVCKKDWKVLTANSKKQLDASNAIDENPTTAYKLPSDLPQEIVIDLGKLQHLKGFTYLPMQSRAMYGIISKYEFLVSTNGKNWKSVHKGEFGNIWNNPITQKITFKSTDAKFIKLKAIDWVKEKRQTAFGEIGIITK